MRLAFATLWALVGLFLIVCAIAPPPFFATPSPFMRIVGAVVGVTSIVTAIDLARE